MIRSDAQRKAIFASYSDRMRPIAVAGFKSEEPMWMRLLPSPNKLGRFVQYYPGMELEDAGFNPLGEWYGNVSLSGLLDSDEDGDGTPLKYDWNPYGSFQIGTSVPIGSSFTPNIEQVLASGVNLYRDEQ